MNRAHILRRTLVALALALCVTVGAVGGAAADSAVRRSAPNDKGLISITFDDGPHPKYTREILDILDEYGAHATFFVIGSNAEAHPELLKEIVERGHEIGNHTYSHQTISKVSDNKITDELTRTQKIISSACGFNPVVFRPPGGAYSNRSLAAVTNLGFACVTWSKDSNDWRMLPVETIVKNMTTDVQSGDIFLFHDFNRRGSPTPEAVSQILATLRSQGYSFVTVSELLGQQTA